jgi:LDH2 family malate/lactate/ureidoglycolate dehydrogenase
VLIPGELEERKRQQRLANGIPIPEAVYEQLRELSDRLGVEVPAAKS